MSFVRVCTLVKLLFFPLKLRFHCGWRAVYFVRVFLHCLPVVPSHLSILWDNCGFSCCLERGSSFNRAKSISLTLYLPASRGPLTQFSPNFLPLQWLVLCTSWYFLFPSSPSALPPSVFLSTGNKPPEPAPRRLGTLNRKHLSLPAFKSQTLPLPEAGDSPTLPQAPVQSPTLAFDPEPICFVDGGGGGGESGGRGSHRDVVQVDSVQPQPLSHPSIEKIR